MSNPQNTKQDLDNLARAQQMQINARLTALQAAQTLMGTPGFANKLDGHHVPNAANSIDHVTLLAIAGELDAYIMGNIVQETQDAIAAAQSKLNAPRIVRP